MAGICTALGNPNNCGHRFPEITLDGEVFTAQGHSSLDGVPLTADEKQQLVHLLVRYQQGSKGLNLLNFLGRVVCGEEATNVKAYTLFGPGISITKANIGASYVNILTEANGGRALIDFTGCTQFRAFLNGVLPGTGPHGVRLIKDGDSTVLYENDNIPANASERELDTGWTNLPAGFTGQELIRAQAKSATAADDPTFKRIVVLVK